MAEYINRDDAIKVVNQQNAITMTRASMTDAINSIPAADVVPIVRCKDCRYGGVYNTGNLYCMHQGGMLPSTPSDFCCHGELKEGDDE